MAENQPSIGRDQAMEAFIGRVRTAALLGTVIWLFTMLAVVLDWFDTRWDDHRGMHRLLSPLILATPLFLALVLPALVLSFRVGVRRAKIATGLLVAALIVFVAMLIAPFAMPLFR
jgi:predicted ferric reductase